MQKYDLRGGGKFNTLYDAVVLRAARCLEVHAT